MCGYACVCADAYILICASLDLRIYVLYKSMRVCTYVCVCLYRYVWKCAYYVYMYVAYPCAAMFIFVCFLCSCEFVSMSVFVYLCMFLCGIYICMRLCLFVSSLLSPCLVCAWLSVSAYGFVRLLVRLYGCMSPYVSFYEVDIRW